MAYPEDFVRIVEHTLKWEGGETVDTGGHTKYGISKNAHPEVDIDSLTRDGAIAIYFEKYYAPACDRVYSFAVRAKYFDLGVNMGRRQATRLLQSAANEWLADTGSKVEPLIEDGLFGRKTAARVNLAGASLLPYFVLEATKYYNKLAKKRTYRKYLHGWLNRLLDIQK
jgi:lysozyme family protein